MMISVYAYGKVASVGNLYQTSAEWLLLQFGRASTAMNCYFATGCLRNIRFINLKNIIRKLTY